MENQLYDDKVINILDSTDKCMENNSENKSMIQLESTLLDMASTPDLCKGGFEVGISQSIALCLTAYAPASPCLGGRVRIGWYPKPMPNFFLSQGM